MVEIHETNVDALIERYEVLLIDAYGVLVTHSSPLPGAKALLDHLRRIEKSYFILSNDASRLPETTAIDYAKHGLRIDASLIINSGTLLAPFFAQENLQGSRCFVLGPEDSKTIVEQAGGEVVREDGDFDVLVIGDEEGFPFVETVDHVLTVLLQGADSGRTFHLICPNPDLIYPAGGGFGITAGSVAVMLEAILSQRYPERPDLRFTYLGKPHPAIYEQARRQAGTSSLVMIGDQLATDILGANRCGIDSALVRSGLAGCMAHLPEDESQPTYVLEDLCLRL